MRAWTILVATILIAGQAAAASPTPAGSPMIPVETFARLPFIETPRLSPDGTKIAAKVAIDGQLRLAIVTLGDFAHSALINLGDADLNGWSWVNDGWLVARIGTLRAVDGDWYIRRTVALRADGRKSVQLSDDKTGQNADDILWIAHDGTPHILLSLQKSIYSDDSGFWPEVRDYDVSTGRSRMVLGPVVNVSDWYADGAGTVRMGLSYSDRTRTSKLLYRDTQRDQFRTIDRASGIGNSIDIIPALFLSEAGKAIAFDDRDGYDSLYALDLATLKTGERIFGAPGFDIERAITDESGARLIGARYTDTIERTNWFDPKLAAIQADLDRAVGPRHRPRIVSWSRDFSVLIVQIGAADVPGAYYVYRQADGVLHLLAQINDQLPAAAYAPVTTVHYRARDGLDLSAVLTLPRNRAAQDLPLILMPHGGPFARDDESWDWWTQFLADRGYAVLQPNYRGSSGYGAALVRKGAGQWGLAMQDDLVDAVRWAARQGLADPARVCIVGASYAGYAALRAAQRDKGVFRCAISYAGVADMPAMLRYDASFLNGTRSKDYLRAQAPDLHGVSPINFAADFSIPVLLFHGGKDQVVPVKQSRSMAARLKNAGKPYDYVEQPLADHYFTRGADRLEFLKRMAAFLEKHNPA